MQNAPTPSPLALCLRQVCLLSAVCSNADEIFRVHKYVGGGDHATNHTRSGRRGASTNHDRASTGFYRSSDHSEGGASHVHGGDFICSFSPARFRALARLLQAPPSPRPPNALVCNASTPPNHRLRRPRAIATSTTANFSTASSTASPTSTTTASTSSTRTSSTLSRQGHRADERMQPQPQKPATGQQEAPASVLILHVASSQPATIQRVLTSLDALLEHPRDWISVSLAVVLYDGSSVRGWDVVASHARTLGTAFEVRTGHRLPSAKLVGGRAFYPKLQFWLQAIDLIERSTYVWLADEDISFRGCDVSGYMQRLLSAFPARGPPLISQPLIRARATTHNGNPAGKWGQMLNTVDLWRGEGCSRVVAVETSYVEQQAYPHRGFKLADYSGALNVCMLAARCAGSPHRCCSLLRRLHTLTSSLLMRLVWGVRAVVQSSFFIALRPLWTALAKVQHEHGSDFALDTLW